MALSLFNDDTSWEDARHAVRHTRAALVAAPAHGKLASGLTALLKKWSDVDAQVQEADDAIVDANALVHYWDVQLDTLVKKLASQAKNDHGAGSSEFGALFPEAPNEIVRLGLESEITRVEKFDVVAKEKKLTKAVLAILKEIDHTVTSGKKAIEARTSATTQAAQVSLRVQAWKDDANAARRSVNTALDDYANTHHLGRNYASAFFPAGHATHRTHDAPASTAPASPSQTGAS